MYIMLKSCGRAQLMSFVFLPNLYFLQINNFVLNGNNYFINILINKIERRLINGSVGKEFTVKTNPQFNPQCPYR